ncbi:MAG: succinate--CoA ligase subunit alpha [Bacteroides sp.]|nr:succinate--CoA ligase subunit alpha [Bacteroides sp.]MDD4720693.1 succinate--CoA ligase subunit alpha [Bacteroides sp.]
MSILINKQTRLIVQGITGRDGRFHASRMRSYNPSIVVGGVSPYKGGEVVDGLPVFHSVFNAVKETQANTSIIFVPAPFAKDAIIEAADAGIRLIICITEGIPTLDVIDAYRWVQLKGAQLIGPNCPGLITPNECLAGILPGNIFQKGSIGIISRSGTLTYEVVHALTKQGMGQSTVVGVGGDPVVGLYYKELLALFEADEETKAMVLIGEIGGNAEEEAAAFIAQSISKPVVAYIVGRTAPPDKQMGHAGAIISSGEGTAQEKIDALKDAGVSVALSPSEIPLLLNQKMVSSR